MKVLARPDAELESQIDVAYNNMIAAPTTEESLIALFAKLSRGIGHVA